MSDAETPSRDDAPPAARFPWAPAVLAAAGVALAAWLWMRHSYAWAVTPRVLTQEAGFSSSRRQSWDRAYARLRGTAGLYGELSSGGFQILNEPARIRVGELVDDEPDDGAGPWRFPRVSHDVRVRVPRSEIPQFLQHGEWTGRVVTPTSAGDKPLLDATASRFAPESVAGLVVGAWGLFIFALYLRTWLRERKAAA